MVEIGRFSIGNRPMVVVRTKGGASVLDFADYKRLVKIYNRK